MLLMNLGLDVTHCYYGGPMRKRHEGMRWSGIEEISYAQWACENCGLRVDVQCTDLSPLPTGAA